MKQGASLDPKKLVEDHPCLAVGSLGRGLLKRSMSTSGSEIGVFAFQNSTNPLLGLFSIQKTKECIQVVVMPGNTYECSTINLISHEATFGYRPYFLCPGCGTRRNRLYLRHRLFRCRACFHLAYESTRYTQLMLRPLKKWLRAEKQWYAITRITYRKACTRKTRRYIELSRQRDEACVSHTI